MAAKPKPTSPDSSAIPEVGTKAPAFHLADQDGTKHRLSDYAGQHVVLYFYPKDDTSGCTAQACQFRDDLPKFEKLDAVILGVSPQDEKSKAKFANKYDLNFPVLADLEAKVCTKYGVWQQKSMYGKKYMGVVRTTFLLDPKGKIIERWDKVKVPKHAEAVMQALKDQA